MFKFKGRQSLGKIGDLRVGGLLVLLITISRGENYDGATILHNLNQHGRARCGAYLWKRGVVDEDEGGEGGF